VKLSSFEAIVEALHRRGVRYLVAGGLAVVAHGYLRLTKDVDLDTGPDGGERRPRVRGARLPTTPARGLGPRMRNDRAPEDRESGVEPNWKEHRREQLRRWAALPLREQLAAVEEMGELARRIQGAPVVGAEPSTPTPRGGEQRSAET
jgi:hypothetical protein